MEISVNAKIHFIFQCCIGGGLVAVAVAQKRGDEVSTAPFPNLARGCLNDPSVNLIFVVAVVAESRDG